MKRLEKLLIIGGGLAVIAVFVALATWAATKPCDATTCFDYVSSSSSERTAGKSGGALYGVFGAAQWIPMFGPVVFAMFTAPIWIVRIRSHFPGSRTRHI